jgi:DNA polymerase-3 subunit epsilon/exodeoxyribonuclease X
MVGHNANVYVDVLRRKLGDWKTPEVFDTLKLARRLLPMWLDELVGRIGL